MREQIRYLSQTIAELQIAVSDSIEILNEQRALRGELITAKTKSERAVKAGTILKSVQFDLCPECGRDVSNRDIHLNYCRLCGSVLTTPLSEPPLEVEVLRRDLNNRIDELTDSIRRREQQLEKTNRQLAEVHYKKQRLDNQLQEELSIYDSR